RSNKMPSDIAEALTQDQLADSLEPAPIVGTEPAQDTEAEGEVETQEAETQPAPDEVEETADDWLPTEQEKVFPLDVLVKFGARYQYTQEEIEADPRLQNALKDKLNSD